MLLNVTMRYDEAEDRIKVCLMPSEGAVSTIWLTQRLLDRFWHGLFGWYVNPPPASDGSRGHEPDMARTAPERFETDRQQASRAINPQGDHFEDFGSGEVWLASEISLTIHSAGMVVTLQAVGGQKCRLPFDEPRFLAWLKILRHCHQCAGWREPEWPVWMESSSSAPRLVFPSLH
ncbi:hypothetical protein [Rhabdaerophilum sp. SD176]|uniref:hypothetical protein n=1 Tax=Rhabdaerophilum sp. SD176 TaxID=2983548 RepID=UPI0024DF959E|nr:hypothetical protein [Rhabdaerophilum sp. SD176]